MPDMNDINTELLPMCKNLKKELADFLKSPKSYGPFPWAPDIIVKIALLDKFVWDSLQRGAVFSFPVLRSVDVLITIASDFYGLKKHPFAVPCKNCGALPTVHLFDSINDYDYAAGYYVVICPKCGHRGQKIDALLSYRWAVALWNSEQQQMAHKSTEQLYNDAREFREHIEN